MRKLKQRIISGMLSLAMILSLTPTSVYATTVGTDTDAISSTEEIMEEEQSNIESTSEEVISEETTDTTTEDSTTEIVTSELTKETTEEETTESTTEEKEIIDASTLSYRLIVGTSNTDILTNGIVISSLDDLYIIGYASDEERNAGINYYTPIADIVEKDDSIFNVSDDDYINDNVEVINQNDAFSTVDTLDEANIAEKDFTIALIDTGANDKVVDSVSVIGDSSEDDNGHGTMMINCILEENPNAKILSIKALDKNGKGSASDIYAAIRYAIDSNVSVINLSLTAYNTAENSIIKDIIKEAVSNNIIVVGAAGNNSKDIKYFIPGCVDEAIIIGASELDGSPTKTTNYGLTVDYFVDANSTSVAASRFTGILSSTKTIDNIEENDKIHKINYDYDENYAIIDDFNKDKELQAEIDNILEHEKDNSFKAASLTSLNDLRTTTTTINGETKTYYWPYLIKVNVTWLSADYSRYGTDGYYYNFNNGNGNDDFYYCGSYFNVRINDISYYGTNVGADEASSEPARFSLEELQALTGDVYDYESLVRSVQCFCCDSRKRNPADNSCFTLWLQFRESESNGTYAKYSGGGYDGYNGWVDGMQRIGGTAAMSASTPGSSKIALGIHKEDSITTPQDKIKTSIPHRSMDNIVYCLYYNDGTTEYPLTYNILNELGFCKDIIPTSYAFDTSLLDGMYFKNTITKYIGAKKDDIEQFFASQFAIFAKDGGDDHPIYIPCNYTTDGENYYASNYYYKEINIPATVTADPNAVLPGTNIPAYWYDGVGYSNYVHNPNTVLIRPNSNPYRVFNVYGDNNDVASASSYNGGLGANTTEEHTYLVSGIDDRAEVRPKGSIQVLKVNADTKTATHEDYIGGATYSLYVADSNYNYSAASFKESAITSTEDHNKGLATFYNLDSGYYVVKETKAADGYDLDPHEYKIKITATNANTVANVQGISLWKNPWINVNEWQGYYYNFGYIFDYSYYINNYSDIDSVTHAEYHYPSISTTHIVNSGIKQGRRANATFDVRAYAARYREQLYNNHIYYPEFPNGIAAGQTDSSLIFDSTVKSYYDSVSTRREDYTDNLWWWDRAQDAGGNSWSTIAFHYASGSEDSGIAHNYKTISDAEYLNIPLYSVLYSNSNGVYKSYYEPVDNAANAIIKSGDSQPESVTVVKSIKNNTEAIYRNNPAYSLAGTEIGIYDDFTAAKNRTDAWIAKFVLNADGSINFNSTQVKTGATKNTTNQKIYVQNKPTSLFAIELKAGNGYKLSDTVDAKQNIVWDNYSETNPLTFNITNEPKSDPINLQLKKTNTDGSDYTINNNINPNGAEYEVKQYYCTREQYLAGGQTPVATATFTTSTHIVNNKNTPGVIDLLYDSPTSGSLNRISKESNGTNYYYYSIGFYVMKETKAPEGLLLSDDEFYCQISNNPSKPNSTTRTYWLNHNGQTTQVGQETQEYIFNAGNLPTPITMATKEPPVWHKLALVKDDHDKEINEPSGDAELTGAQYQVYTYYTDIFTHNNNYNGHTYSIDSQNRVLVDGNILTITTDKYGFGETPYPVIYSLQEKQNNGVYYVKESKAPTGYLADTATHKFDPVQLNANNQIIQQTTTNVIGPKHQVDTYVTTPQTYINAKGRLADTPITGNIVVSKRGILNELEHGDTEFANIKYAVVNRSTNSIKYNNTIYENGKIIAIISTDTNGIARINEVPYGTYEIYELRKDSTLAAGDVYNTSTAKYGTSIYSNDSYLHIDSLIDSDDMPVIVSSDKTYEVTPKTKSIRTVNTDVKYDFDNTEVQGQIYIHKKDAETNKQQNQGINRLDHINYVIVNRSAKAVTFNSVSYNNGVVIAKLTTDENGNCFIKNVPYGTYDVYELRQDATISVGDVYDNSNKLGTSIKANDYYLYLDDIATKGINLTNTNPTYTVEKKHPVVRQAGYKYENDFSNAPIRSDMEVKKYDIDGYPMSYIPYLVSLVDNDDNVIEQHVILSDNKGIVNTKTRKNKSKLTVNTLDQYYSNGVYTGPLTDEAANVNIWFGNITEYSNDSFIHNDRGSLLYGHYIIKELPCASNNGQDMLETSIDVQNDLEVVSPENVLIDLNIVIESDALDLNTDSQSATVSENASIKDTLMLTHLKTFNTYRVKFTATNIKKDNSTEIIGTYTTEPFTPEASDNTMTVNNYRIEQIFNINTANAEPGSYVAISAELYQYYNGTWTNSAIASHNMTYTDDRQKLVIPDMTTEAFNDSTNRLRIGSIDPPSEIDDTITYKNLGNRNFYIFNTTLVYNDGSIVKDVNGNDCTCELKMYTDNRYNNVFLRNGTIIGPTDGSFKLSDVGIAPFVISAPNTTFYITEKLDAISYDAETGTPEYKTIVSHNLNKDEEIETIRYVKIQTTAGSVKTGVEGISIQGLIPNNTEATLRDIITYTNVAQDVEVVIEGQVVEKDNPENIVATSSKTIALPITLGDAQGTTYMDFTFDSTPYANKKLVVFERVYLVQDENKVLISEHCDVNDENQIVRVPDVHTTLNSVVNHEKYKVTKNYGEITVIDTVEYKNVKPGISYTLNAILYDKQTNQPAIDFEGNTITKSVTFTPDAENGFKDVEITFTSVLRGTDWETDDGYVAFEELKGHDDVTYAVHNDIEDEGQTVRNPKFKTKAINLKETKYIVAAPNQKITDIVTLRNFDKAKLDGDTFTLVIKAVDAETGEDLTDTDGNVYTNSKTFVWNGQTEEPIDIIIDATGLEGKTIVFYEDLYYGDTPSEETELLREHTQDSHLQSVYIPYIGTQATDAEINIQLLALNRQLKDVIDLKNLIPDTDYKIVTKIWDKTTQRFVKTLEDAEYEYVSDYHSPSNNIEENDYTNANYSVNDTVEITMDLSNVEDIAGHDIVVFEYMYDSDNDFYAEHAKEEAPEQTLQVPDGHTTALAEDTNDHITVADEHTHIIDTIHYENLIPNIEYTVTGTVMLREEIDGEITAVPLKDKDGKVVTTTTTFVPTEKTGDDLTVEFDIDTTKLQNKTLVIFEDMLYNDVTIFVHHDISDEEQSIHIPDGHTTALDNKTKDHIAYPEEKMSFVDTITYSNLLPNKKYTAIGTIMVVDGKKTYELKDKNGKIITSKVTFTADESNGTVDVPFEIDATLLKGKTIVVFEDVSYNDITVFVHHDIEDTEQTIKFPSGHTTAVDSNTKEHMTVANKDTVIIDTIHYENLIPNKKYTATGTLYSVKTGKPYEVDGKTFSKTVTFTPSEPNGDVEVPIKMSTAQLEGSTIVVFEDVYYNDNLVFMHHELKDENQSVHITKLRTKATDKVDNDNIIDGTSQEQTIIDTVKYENLIKGKKYTVVGKLVIKPTEEQLKDANYKPEYVLDENNKPLEAKVTFVADKSNGEIQVPFTIDASKYAGKKLVAFESVSYNKKEIAVHTDVTDEEQTITVSLRLHVKIAKADKDNVKYYLKNAEITIFNQDGTIAKDIDGKDCVGVTNENGEVDFTILYDENNTYYAQETKAPNGYNLNKDKFEIKPSGDRETLGTDLIKINILDSIIIIPPKKTPPKTDDMIHIIYIISIIGLGFIGIMVFRKRKKY